MHGSIITITKLGKGVFYARFGLKKLMDKIEFVIHCWGREMRSEKLDTRAQKKGKATTALPFDKTN